MILVNFLTVALAQTSADTKKNGLAQKRQAVVESGAVGRNRTGDLRVTSALLYRLSYNGEG